MDPSDSDDLDRTRKQINRLVNEIANLESSQLEPAYYFREFLSRVMKCLAAPSAGAYLRQSTGELRLVWQINHTGVGLQQKALFNAHEELINATVRGGQPVKLSPFELINGRVQDGTSPQNLLPYFHYLVPLWCKRHCVGLIEVFQNPERNLNAQEGMFQFTQKMAELASSYVMRQSLGSQNTAWWRKWLFWRQPYLDIP